MRIFRNHSSQIKMAVLLAITTVWISFVGKSYAGSGDLEYKLKAAFLLNFAKFIVEPGSTLSSTSYQICIFGDDNFESALIGLDKKSVAGKSVDVLKTYNENKLGTCNMVFVSGSEKYRYRSLLPFLDQFPVVTISDIPRFAKSGGIIEFVNEGDRLRFIINRTKAKEKGIKIKAALLELATEVL